MKFQDFKVKSIQKNEKLRKEYLNVDSNFDFEVSQLITEARIRYGLTQVQLAKMIGTKQPSIARLERGTASPSLLILKKISKALGTSLIPPKFGFMIEDHEISLATKSQNSMSKTTSEDGKPTFKNTFYPLKNK